jgi:predicted O-methyltransferase YrrM
MINLRDPELSRYVMQIGTRETAVQARLRAATAPLPLAQMQVSPDQGQLLAFLVTAIGAHRAIEIGTFTGYSALAIAAALPDDGELITCDVDEEITAIARRFWDEAGLARKITLRLAPARETLEALLAEGQASRFDFAFIDADKPSYDDYYEGCLRLVRPGGLIALDNMLRGGAVANPGSGDEEARVMDRLNRKIRDDERVDMCLLPMRDGLTLVRAR